MARGTLEDRREKVEKIARYILSTGATYHDAGKVFDVHLQTMVRYINVDLPKLNPLLYEKVKEKVEHNKNRKGKMSVSQRIMVEKFRQMIFDYIYKKLLQNDTNEEIMKITMEQIAKDLEMNEKTVSTHMKALMKEPNNKFEIIKKPYGHTYRLYFKLKTEKLL